MDSKTVRQFAQALQMFDTDVTAKEAEQNVFSVLNQLDNSELEKYLEAAKKIATLNEGEDSVRRTLKDLFNEIFPALSFYPALGMWGLVDKLIQNGGISGLDTADRDKLLVYSALFFGMVGGKIAYNRIKERVNEIKSSDSQISEVLEAAGVENAGIEENPYRTSDNLVDYAKSTMWRPELDEDSVNNDTTDWSVRDGVKAIAHEKGISNHDAEKEYAEKHGMDFGEVYDLCMYGDEHFTLDQAKKELENEEQAFYNAQNADDSLYSNGGWNAYQNRISYLRRVINRLEKKPIKESYESEVRTLLGNGKIDRELAEQPWAKNPPEVNEEEWSLVSYKDFDIIVYHYHEGSDEEDEKFEVEIYPKGQADDTKPPIDYMNSHSWIKCLEKIAEVANKNKKEDNIEPEEDGNEYDWDYTKVNPEATKELSEWMNKWVSKTPLEQAIKYVNDGMKAKYGREYPKEEDESDYRRELCSAAAKKFNISLDKITDKIASDYVDSMPYVIQDKQGNYSEI